MIGEVPVVIAPAEIDITTADQLRTVLLTTATRGHVPVVVDLSLTRFCDCWGRHPLRRQQRRPQAKGEERGRVIPAGGTVPRILALTRLDRLIPCFASLEEAVARAP